MFVLKIRIEPISLHFNTEPFKKDKTIPVKFHNGQKYDFRLLVRSLERADGHIQTIAKNSKQYISVKKAVRISEHMKVDKNEKPNIFYLFSKITFLIPQFTLKIFSFLS